MNDFLSRLLAMLRLDDNGHEPGVRMLCSSCGTVRLAWVRLCPLGNAAVAVRGSCPRCGRQVEAKLQV